MRRMTVLFLGLALVNAAAPAAADELFFLNVPGVAGDVTTRGYLGWISVTSFTEGFSNAAANRSGAGGATGRTSCQNLHVIKPLDVTSPELALAVATGRVFGKIELVAVRSSNGAPEEFLRFTLSSVMISSVAFAGDTNTSARTETLVLRPTKVDVQYTPQRADGSLGSPVSALLDCAIN